MAFASSTLSTPQSGPEAGRSDEDLAPGDIAVGVIIGRASEYFDFFVFGIASVLVFPQVFFPMVDRLTGTLYAFLIFALAFVVRPIGTLIGMSIQRHFGRSTKLTAALFLLGSSTVGMGLLQGYAEAGAAAIWLLALCRVGQGLALGGSWDGLPSLLALNAPGHRRGWYAMLGQLGAPLGFIVASSVFLYVFSSLDAKDFLSWGWRFPFYTAFAINVVALFARLRLVVTHEYEKRMEEHELDPAYLRELLPAQGHHIVIGAFAALASYALFHLVTVFPLSWVALYGDQGVEDFMKMELLGAFFGAAAMPMSGLIADKIGRRSYLGSLAVAIGVFALLAPLMLGGGKPGQAAFILIGFVLLGLSYGQAAGSVTSNFLPHFRYTGAALTADMAWLLGAAFAPVVALYLSSHFGLITLTAYLMSGALCTLLALRVNKKLREAAVVQD
ncbi:MAG: MFS transporter [Proteobacteria bacterium]|jgi:MFS family permease|nr:MFS transporter [Methylibium sp.]MBY0367346.1 MFS transporter [Burkholderiaceae bacterium]MCH8855027.1 MFS transporter [Pseudomonadota bacterium]|mmetsp:Transcript_1244/g.3530  ORF Transcript_1244/g.3530 Transcript_1244/m.3530 type:complete len:444 (+) Transcript_1244:467-1798(+)